MSPAARLFHRIKLGIDKVVCLHESWDVFILSANIQAAVMEEKQLKPVEIVHLPHM